MSAIAAVATVSALLILGLYLMLRHAERRAQKKAERRQRIRDLVAARLAMESKS